MKLLLCFLLLPFCAISQQFTPQEIARYKAQANRVTIITDQYGIPHIYGKKDADAVFGLMYTQAEQNFPRIERNYLEVFGRLAEIDGQAQVFDDLQMQLIYDSSAAKADYQRSPQWLKQLLNAFADGINYYLYRHPEVKPAVLKKFQPWFPLMYTDGSISATQMGDINTFDTRSLYGAKTNSTSFQARPRDQEQVRLSGSNGFAVAPSKTASGNSILYINPHVTFYFRSEVQMASEEGLNVYGAVTWGNFFVYQGFNEHCGWMHTSSYADVADVYKEKVQEKQGKLFYEYDGQLRPVTSRSLVIRYRKGQDLVEMPVTAYYTHHGPVMGSRNGTWLSLKERNRSLEALEQSWLRTKAKTFGEFRKIMELRSNNSNNTVYADDQKNIAYWHGNFMPVRDPKLEWSLPVDGSTSATEWKGVHKLDEIVQLFNPKSGFIQNCNSTPFTASGESSPKPEAYPAYMAPDGQNPRAVNASRLLAAAQQVSLDSIIRIGYSHYLSGFEILLPSLFAAYDSNPGTAPANPALQEAIAILKQWDRNSGAMSTATTLAVEWATRLLGKVPPAKTDEAASNVWGTLQWMAENITAADKIKALGETINDLNKWYGQWQMPWGEVNRYQRNEKSTNADFDDAKPSFPVGLASATWGSLPSFNGRRFQGTKKRYGVSGNSFIAAVEFGKRVKARTIMTGGESFDPASPHFTDQAEGYINGKFKDVLFYKEDVLKQAVRTYHPGE
ncbi:MAG TPA: penicillin acylase family protein [Flavisolibacter sp.]|nr:penicillin acylase family protein [Flavisolibacter sp.]